MRLGRLTNRERLSRILLVTASVAIPLALVELAVHVIEARRGPMFPGGTRTLSFARPDPTLGSIHQADFAQRYGWPEHPDGYLTIATNNLGLREDDPTKDQPAPGVRRVLALGDSQTDGLVNNDESWPNVLERTAGTPAEPWEVLNAGVTGHQPGQYYDWWRQFGRQLEPDLVLVGYYLGNDLATGLEADQTDGDGGDPTDEVASASGPVAQSGFQKLVVALRHRCRLCALASFVAHRSFLDGPTYEESLFVWGGSAEEARAYLAATRHCLGCLWQSVEQQWRIDEDHLRYERHLATTEALLTSLLDEVQAADAELVVVLIPSKLQVEPGAATLARETAELLGMPGTEPPLENRLQRDMEELLARLGIQAIGVRAELEAEHATSGRPVYYDGDWHLNVAGSRVVGEAVATALEESTSR